MAATWPARGDCASSFFQIGLPRSDIFSKINANPQTPLADSHSPSPIRGRPCLALSTSRAECGQCRSSLLLGIPTHRRDQESRRDNRDFKRHPQRSPQLKAQRGMGGLYNWGGTQRHGKAQLFLLFTEQLGPARREEGGGGGGVICNVQLQGPPPAPCDMPCDMPWLGQCLSLNSKTLSEKEAALSFVSLTLAICFTMLALFAGCNQKNERPAVAGRPNSDARLCWPPKCARCSWLPLMCSLRLLESSVFPGSRIPSVSNRRPGPGKVGWERGHEHMGPATEKQSRALSISSLVPKPCASSLVPG